jgi:hypothetical protein
MKKLKNTLFVVIFLVLGLSFFIWNYKTSLIQQIISKHLNNVPVYLEEFKITNNSLVFEDFFIGNYSNAKTGVSFGSKKIALKTNFYKIADNPFIIDSLTLKDTLIGIEYYNKDGSKNNWDTILKSFDYKELTKKKYLIKKIILKNLTVQVTDYKGKITKYPLIDTLVFYNLSDSDKYPINKIDKVILNTILRAVYARIGLGNLLDSTDNKVVVPHFIMGKSRENSGG